MDETRFWERLRKSADPDGCWEWTGSNAGDRPYGKVSFRGRQWKTHRLAWTLAYGVIPAGMNVCHRCDNPACCRPSHLFLGTQRDNMRDAASKGRVLAQAHPERVPRGDSHYFHRHPDAAVRGDRHGLRRHPECVARGQDAGPAKLTNEQVLEIRRLAAEGVTYKTLAELFEVNRYNIGKIVRRETWQHL